MKKIINKIKSIFVTRKFGSFFVIGLINTLSSQLLYILFVTLSITASLSSLFSDILTMVLSYFLNMKFTYKIKPSFKTFVSFPFSYIPGWIVNMLMVIICVDLLHVREVFAKLVSIPITVPLNFIVMSFIMKHASKK